MSKWDNARHRNIRKQLILDPLKRDGYVRCVTCGRVCTRPDQVDLGHDTTDPTGSRYRGAQCVPCNRGEGGRIGARITNARRRRVRIVRRAW